MADKYSSIAELSESESEGSYRIEIRPTGSAVALVAPHAGKIEPRTSEICRSVAAEDLTYYLFEGRKVSNNQDLHITSARFDEPTGVRVAEAAQMVVTFHGQSGEGHFVNVGGLADSICNLIIDHLKLAGFSASRHSDPRLQGRTLGNICNRGTERKGVQLEISRGLREELYKDHKKMASFSEAIRLALAKHYPV